MLGLRSIYAGMPPYPPPPSSSSSSSGLIYSSSPSSAAGRRTVLHAGRRQQQQQQQQGSSANDRAHIKKPLNAFMLYMKEMRPKIVAECTLKESAAINQILGRRVSNFISETQISHKYIAN